MASWMEAVDSVNRRSLNFSIWSAPVRPSVGGKRHESIRSRVMQAHELQRHRFAGKSHQTNAAMGARQVKEHCQLDAESAGYLDHAMEQMNFSVRAHDRILKVARTLADLAGSERILPNDTLEAIPYRSLDRNLFQ